MEYKLCTDVITQTHVSEKDNSAAGIFSASIHPRHDPTPLVLQAVSKQPAHTGVIRS